MSRPGRPERLVRSVLASRKCAEEFGPMVHQAAWERNFFGAGRRAFWGTDCRRTGRSSVGTLVHSRRFSTSCTL